MDPGWEGICCVLASWAEPVINVKEASKRSVEGMERSVVTEEGFILFILLLLPTRHPKIKGNMKKSTKASHFFM